MKKDREYKICGISGELHPQKFNDTLRAICGLDIRTEHKRLQIGLKVVEMLYVARRLEGEKPIRFIKNGPELKAKSLLFKRDEIVFRRINSNAIAEKPADYEFLYSLRKPPSLEIFVASEIDNSRMTHTLPDRALICSQFVGRSNDLDELWEWLADDFSRVRLIAGEGGLGKTSLAYRFCEELIKRQVKPFETVTWLTAKGRQFIPATDDYRHATEVDFNDAVSLFKKIAFRLGATDEELECVDPKTAMQLALQTCETTPSIVVVDDVDSLSDDDQKRALEFGMRAPLGTKLLLTTRVNFSYSSDNVLKLEGLSPDDFSEFSNVLRKKYNLPPATVKQATSFRQASGGSPLFADSILRLERRGLPFDQAIGQWKGQKGIEARKAALQQEVRQLSREAKRMLLLISVLKNCTYTELSQILEYSEQTLGDALQELASLFLVSAPAIAKEARFTVEPNTGLLVIEISQTLGIDHTALVAAAKKNEKDAVEISLVRRSNIVGQAISQAIAKLKDKDSRAALNGILDAHKRLTKSHPDLLMMMGRCYLEQTPANNSEAAKCLDEAYKLGQRRSMLFSLWFKAEYGRENFDAALDVSNFALAQQGFNTSEWHERRAHVRISRARRAYLSKSEGLAFRELDAAIKDLNSAQSMAASETEKRRLYLLIDQSLALKANFMLRDINRGYATLESLEQAQGLCKEYPENFEIIHKYIEGVELVLLDAMKRHIGKPKGSDRSRLEAQIGNAIKLGSADFSRTPPISFRNQFHSFRDNVNRYENRRDV